MSQKLTSLFHLYTQLISLQDRPQWNEEKLQELLGRSDDDLSPEEIEELNELWDIDQQIYEIEQRIDDTKCGITPEMREQLDQQETKQGWLRIRDRIAAKGAPESDRDLEELSEEEIDAMIKEWEEMQTSHHPKGPQHDM